MELAVGFARAVEEKSQSEAVKEQIIGVRAQAKALKAKNKPLENLQQ